jgi:uncharacterized membrane protein HdeD (DUF308 family)
LHAAAVFTAHRANVALLDLLSAVLYAIAGTLALRQPVGAALILNAVVAALFLTNGILRIVAALTHAPPNWGAMAVHGIVTVGLASLLFYSLPNSALYFTGLVITCDFIASGVSLMGLGFALRRFSLGVPGQRAWPRSAA